MAKNLLFCVVSTGVFGFPEIDGLFRTKRAANACKKRLVAERPAVDRGLAESHYIQVVSLDVLTSEAPEVFAIAMDDVDEERPMAFGPWETEAEAQERYAAILEDYEPDDDDDEEDSEFPHDMIKICRLANPYATVAA